MQALPSKQIEVLDCPCCGAEFPAVLTSRTHVSMAGGGVLTNTALNIKAFKTRAEAQKEMER